MDISVYRMRSSIISLKYKIRGLLHMFEVDRAVFFGILAKIWSTASGPLTALLVIIKFTPEYQGYYYTFGSLLALQVFVELGLGTVIIQFASHEWSRLKMDDSGSIVGDDKALSRLASLASITFKWYIVGGAIIAIGLGLGGYIFFLQSHNNANVNWSLPWLSICFFTGISICLIPIWSLLEGCNQVSTVYTYRFFQGIIASMAIWIAIISGAKLWSASIFVAATTLCTILFLKYKYWNFIKSLLVAKSPGSCINWRKEVLPMQWRIAVSWISGYFVFSFFTPVIFRYHGPVIAGQFGMTWSAILMVSAISGAWLPPKVPMFGMLIAEKKYTELDSIFGRLTKIFVVITVLSAAAVWGMVYALNKLKHPFAARLLPVLPMTLFLIAQIVMMLSAPFSIYLRAHKKEPILFVSIFYALFSALITFILGKYYSVTAIGFGCLALNAIVVPIIILICIAGLNGTGVAKETLMKIVKRIGKLAIFVSMLPFVMILRMIRPLFWIRFIDLHVGRIGHCAANTEIYLSERNAGLHDFRAKDIFCYRPPVCNQQLLRMWARLIPITGSRFIHWIVWANRIIPGGEPHELIKSNGERDVHGLINMHKQPLSFTREEEDRGQKSLRALGIAQGAPFICFHSRDNAYLTKMYPQYDWSYHDYRDEDVKNYCLAIRSLTDRGYHAVRMGSVVKDKFPLSGKGITDYASGEMRNDFLDLYLLSKCSFYINSECGLSNIARLFRRPVVCVNQIPMDHMAVWYPNNMVICKKLWLKAEKRFLKFREILKSDIGRFLNCDDYAKHGIEVIQNTSEEIRDAAEEVEGRLRGSWKTSDEHEELQRRFWLLYEPNELHSVIRARIGSNFLAQNQDLLD
ncbi:MAG: TIGR04372 family glycosyltransferase [Candidatus Omnitrophica bacterium]|nr:TIGR04372 family glycosyltransferase [Candidatus Omnitrophota bacterium]